MPRMGAWGGNDKVAPGRLTFQISAGCESSPAVPSGKFRTIQLDLLAIPREAGNLSTSFPKASVVSSRGQKPQVDSEPLGLLRPCFVLSPKALGQGPPRKRRQKP